MRILSCLLLFGVVLAAQTPRKTTPAARRPAEPALRARISGFYQAHVDGKFRQADLFVAPESKDAFFEADKQRLLSFQIQNITFESSTRAKATVVCEFSQSMPFGSARYNVKMPRVSLWKLIRGNWYWYTVPSQFVDTPFGPAKITQPATPGKSDAQNIPAGPSVNDVVNQVIAEQSVVQLSDSDPSTGEITIKNSLPGTVKLTLPRIDIPGLEMKLEKEMVGRNEKARVLFRYTPPEKGRKPPKTAYVQVEPTGEMIPIQVVFAPAAAVPGK